MIKETEQEFIERLFRSRRHYQESGRGFLKKMRICGTGEFKDGKHKDALQTNGFVLGDVGRYLRRGNAPKDNVKMRRLTKDNEKK